MKARVCVFALAAGFSLSAFATTATAADVWCGEAAWFDDGGLTASGKVNETGALSGAHPSLPFGTRIKVDNLANGRSVVVRINDRASFALGRVILVSRAAAQELDMIDDGRTNVRLSIVDGDRPPAGGCRDPEVIAESAAPEPPALETPAASEQDEVGEIVAADPTGAFAPPERTDEMLAQSPALAEASEPPEPAALPPASHETLADRFAVAFQPETWQEAEFAKMVAAFAPRLAAPPPRIPIPWPILDRMTPIRLTPILIAYAWSDALSLPAPAGFAPPAVSTRLSQLTQ